VIVVQLLSSIAHIRWNCCEKKIIGAAVEFARVHIPPTIIAQRVVFAMQDSAELIVASNKTHVLRIVTDMACALEATPEIWSANATKTMKVLHATNTTDQHVQTAAVDSEIVIPKESVSVTPQQLE
jgi:hypothetical protein